MKKDSRFSTFRNALEPYAWWELGILIVGLLSLISLIVILFLPYGKGPATFTITGDVPDPSSAPFPSYVAETLNIPLRSGDPITTLNNGDEFLASFLKDVDSASTSINIMTYIWNDGSMSDQVLAHLDAKLKQHVPVRILIDAFGSGTDKPKDKFKTFTDLGGRVEPFNSLTIAPWDFLKNKERNHRRAYVIDGTIAYTGGMTISDLWLGNARNPKEYRDVMFRTTGPMALDLQGVFTENWTSMTGEILAGETYFPSGNKLPVVTSGSPSGSLTYVPLANVPSADSLMMQRMLLISLASARKSIYITNPYFLPDQTFAKILMEKARAGVDVRLLLPNKYNDITSVRYSSHYYYQELLDAGVKIYEYQPTFIHAKTITIDGAWSLIGSANMDNRSRSINNEVVVGVESTTFATTLVSIFMEDLKHADSIDPIAWKNRSLRDRTRELFDLKFLQQY